MRHETQSIQLPARRPGVEDADDAARICARIEATMEALLQLIEAESELLRSGKTLAAAALEAAKNDYARAYIEELDLLRLIGPDLDYYAPGSVERLRHRHEEFVSVLQIDMAALATARAIFDPRLARPARRGSARPERTWSAQRA